MLLMPGNRPEALLPGHDESQSKVFGALRRLNLGFDMVPQGWL
jgi:hypothetical protein